MTTGTRQPRRRRTTAVATAVAAATLGVMGCGGDDKNGVGKTATETVRSTAAADTDGAATATRTLKFESQLAAPARDARPTGNAPGAPMVFTGMLFEPDGEKAIGRSQGACMRTAPGRGEVFQCQLSFFLKTGTIYAQSTASAQGPSDGVITGGTRRWAYLRGTFRYTATGTPRVALTLRLRR